MSKPPQGKPAWRNVEVTDSSGRRYSKPSGEVVGKAEPTTPLDELIRAFDDGDGATIQQRRNEIRERLVELRRYRETLRCEICKRTVLGREPVCYECHGKAVSEFIA